MSQPGPGAPARRLVRRSAGRFFFFNCHRSIARRNDMKRVIMLLCLLGVTGGAVTAWRHLARRQGPSAAAEGPSNASGKQDAPAAPGPGPDKRAELGAALEATT